MNVKQFKTNLKVLTGNDSKIHKDSLNSNRGRRYFYKRLQKISNESKITLREFRLLLKRCYSGDASKYFREAEVNNTTVSIVTALLVFQCLKDNVKIPYITLNENKELVWEINNHIIDYYYSKYGLEEIRCLSRLSEIRDTEECITIILNKSGA